MSNFFQGWRRKAGCVTLGLACVFMLWWVRSMIVPDVIFLPFRSDPGDFRFSAISTGSGNLVVYWFSEVIEVPGPMAPLVAVPSAAGVTLDLLAIRDSIDNKWTEDVAGGTTVTMTVPFAVSTTSTEAVPTLEITFWVIVIPLTVLSAWLLLTKPRKKLHSEMPPQVTHETVAM